MAFLMCEGLPFVALDLRDGFTSVDLVGLLAEVRLPATCERIVKCGELISEELDIFNATLFVNQQRLALFAVKLRRIVRDAHAQGVFE
jgi:hypothetical protein